MAVRDEEKKGMEIETDILIKSIGYASVEMPGVPFNTKTRTIPHEFGCVVDPDTKEKLLGLYVCGWAKRGPVGIIDATLRDTKETFGVLKHHIEAGALPEKVTSVQEIEELVKKGHVSYDQWLKVEKLEKEIGEASVPVKVGEKILQREKMLEVAGK